MNDSKNHSFFSSFQITKTKILIISLTAIGFIARIHNLGFQATNWDEQFTMEFAAPSLSAAQVFWNSLTMDYTPPIYYLLAHFSMIVFGVTEFAIRFPSVIFGTLLIPVMFFIGKEYKDDLYGLLMAGFTTIYYNAYFYSKYGRSYSVVLFFFSLALYFFIRAIKGEKRSEIWFGIFAVLSVWSHLYSSIPLGIMTLYLIWTRSSLPALAPILLLGSIPLAYFYVPLVLTTRISGVGSNTFGMSPAQIAIMTPFDIFGYSAIPILAILIFVLLRKRNDAIFSMIILTVLTTWASMFVLSFKTPIILHYLLMLAPLLILALIYPFWEQAKTHKWKMHYILAAVMIVVMELYQIFLMNTMQRGGSF